MMVNVVAKVFPATVKTLGVTGAIEIIGAASVGAVVLNKVMDAGHDLACNTVENSKKKLEAKKAAALEEKKAAVTVITEETPEKEVSKKNKKLN